MIQYPTSDIELADNASIAAYQPSAQSPPCITSPRSLVPATTTTATSTTNTTATTTATSTTTCTCTHLVSAMHAIMHASQEHI